MPAPPMEKETLSVRIAPQLKTRAMQVAQAKHLSFNSFVTTLLEAAVREVEEQELFRAFTELGGDAEMTDITFAFHAQAEVARHD